MKLAPDEKASDIMNQHIDYIVASIFDNFPKEAIISVILTGSICRGEGSVLIKKNKILVYSDYDINVVVTPNKFLKARRVFSDLSTRLTSDLKKQGLVSHICVSPELVYFLKRRPPTIGTFESKNSDIVLYGRDVLKLIPDYKPHNILKTDAIEMLFNRIAGQFETYQTEEGNYQNVKAILDSAGSLLAYNGEYHVSYKEKALRFKKFQKQFQFDNLEYWTELKLNPDFSEINYWETWNKAREYLLRILDYELTDYFGSEADYIQRNNSLTTFVQFLISKPKLRFLIYRIHPKVYINLGLVHLMKYSQSRDSGELSQAGFYLKAQDKDFNYLTKRGIELWKEVSSSKIKPI